MRLFASIVIGLSLALSTWSQDVTNAIAVPVTNQPPAAAEAPAPEKAWSFSASIYTYIVKDSRDYAQPTFTADHNWLHLEARYNYEGLDTGSAWIGYNFSAGEKLSLEFTPMLGAVFGDTTGVAPGYNFSLSWWKLELYSEGEYLIDTGHSSDNFFYTWSELTLTPIKRFRFGMVVQRTKLYQTDFDIQRGFLAGFALDRIDFTTYVFNPDENPTVVLGVRVNF